jgi:RND superfamily putative drug exporter
VQSIRDRAGGSDGGLQVKVTGAAGYSLDAIKVFGNINGSLLLVAALIVLILLIVIYRSPIFWIIPFFTVLLVEGASRGLGYLLAEAGVTITGQSGGILPVLVFGAGTDYALLLVSRYREELRRHEDKHEAMAIALASAGPAILASGLTVIAALLTLSIAEVNGTAGLGPIEAMGVALAMISMLTMLPAALTICGRYWFWPRIPHPGEAGVDETHGFWRRIGDRVAVRPRAVWISGSIVLVILAANLVNLDTGLTSGNSFRGEVDSVQGQQILARNLPAGASAPTDVIVTDRGRAQAVAGALAARKDLVSQVSKPVEGPPGARLSVTLVNAPYDTTTLAQVPELRRVAKQAGGETTLVGGPTAQEYDLRQSATRDNRMIIPLTLVVVFLILAVLLRALFAPLGDPELCRRARLRHLRLGRHLRLSRRRSRAAAAVLRLPRSAGDRHNIFLMARVREEAIKHGTREGTLRGLAVTGAVITGAGIVLAGTFGALAVPPLVVLTEIGFIVAFGVLLDTFIVRSVIVPALVIDIDRRVWWPSRLSHTKRQPTKTT